MPSKSKIITFEEFEGLCENGHLYTGLVKGVGLVSWVSELVYFVKIKELFKPLYYRQISAYETFVCRTKGFEVISKTKYNLHIIPLDALEYANPNAYREYYPIPPAKKDAIKDYTPDILVPSNSSNQSKFKEALETGADIDDKIGLPLGVAADLSRNKILGGIGKGLTAISIMNDISDGQYISATGQVIKAFSGWYGVAWDVGVMIYESERFIIYDYWATLYEIKIRQRNYEEDEKSNSKRRKMEDAIKNHSRAEERYRELMQRKYGANWYKYRF